MALLGPLDADVPTLHIRCGRDIEQKLRDAGLVGEFLEHSYPYVAGPVQDGPGSLEGRAAFIADHYGVAQALAEVEAAERALFESAAYRRVVIWSEHDAYDQLVLVRLLSHYAMHARPPRIELLTVDRWPGIERFIGLGQLPPEALRSLWPSRVLASEAMLDTGLKTWRALCDADPRPLAALMRAGTPALPLLATALHRHLRELPDVRTGLGFTQTLALDLLEAGPQTLARLVARMTWETDPLPGQGDLQIRDRVLPLTEGPEPLVQGTGSWTEPMQLTDVGRAVRRGERDYHALPRAPRWVGGVEIVSGTATWRWDEAGRDVRFTGPPRDA